MFNKLNVLRNAKEKIEQECDLLRDQLKASRRQLRLMGGKEHEMNGLRTQLYDIEQKNLQIPQM